MKRLYQQLSKQPRTSVTLGESINGHPADAILRNGEGAPTAVLFDPGPVDGSDAARHMRIMLHRRNLMDDSECQGTAIRYPAWKLYDLDSG
ncbi:hypothetical protein ACIBHY_47355 [Nonomuraea sp. NPDC050547]|uniref:hypothetical protein n=1 Tax=Nonomuraea sp. NPDC050547 TaxID=3364368 RepID=UPI00379BB4B1